MQNLRSELLSSSPPTRERRSTCGGRHWCGCVWCACTPASIGFCARFTTSSPMLSRGTSSCRNWQRCIPPFGADQPRRCPTNLPLQMGDYARWERRTIDRGSSVFRGGARLVATASQASPGRHRASLPPSRSGEQRGRRRRNRRARRRARFGRAARQLWARLRRHLLHDAARGVFGFRGTRDGHPGHGH